ncbi:MAG: ATP-binding cassette domain-containing protein, partial [Desulfobacterales bacterium]
METLPQNKESLMDKVRTVETPDKEAQRPQEAVEKGRTLVSRENRETVGQISIDNPRMTCRNVNVYYGEKHAIKNVSLDIGRHEVIAMIGPSGCGKSTFL